MIEAREDEKRRNALGLYCQVYEEHYGSDATMMLAAYLAYGSEWLKRIEAREESEARARARRRRREEIERQTACEEERLRKGLPPEPMPSEYDELPF